MEEPWINMYNPTIKTLLYNDRFVNRLKNITNYLKKNNLDLNIQINGCEGGGKTTILKFILKSLKVNLDKIYYKTYCDKEYCFIYKNVYLFDFCYINYNKLKDIFETIKLVSKTNLLQYKSKIIILENFYCNKEYISHLKNMFEKDYNITKFIIISKYKQISIENYCYNIRVPNLCKVELEKGINNIFLEYFIDIKKSQITFDNIWKVYNDSFKNLKNTLLWIQYHIKEDIKPTMLIKNKLVANLLSYMFGFEYKTFEIIRDKISEILCIGISETDLIKYTIHLINKNKNISNEKKFKINNLLDEFNKNQHHMEHNIILIEHFFNNLLFIFN